MRSNYNLENTLNTQLNNSYKADLWDELEDEAAESIREEWHPIVGTVIVSPYFGFGFISKIPKIARQKF